MNLKKTLTNSIINHLKGICPNGVQQNISLASISRWEVGRVAKCIVSPNSAKQISSIIKFLSLNELPYIVKGYTTNFLSSDRVLDVAAIHIGSKLADYSINEKSVWCQSGICVIGFARTVAQSNLSGIEQTSVSLKH
ncbi:MAG: UDP-N-acetylmuramate dehydrogenase [Polaribacter sp.]|jgi:UDP-N-acetylmuramate dehydrogenase